MGDEDEAVIAPPSVPMPLLNRHGADSIVQCNVKRPVAGQEQVQAPAKPALLRSTGKVQQGTRGHFMSYSGHANR